MYLTFKGNSMHVLGHLTVEEFLRDYWQQKPVVIRDALPEFEALIPADELAGMSLEEDIESRLIIEEGSNGPWEIRKGPFSEADYRALPDNKWTLLIQAVDQYLPEASDLLEHFRFLPSWRIDDLMISYAVDGGSVGPHYDQYDVFLLQAEGQREWRIGQMCSEQSSILEGPALRILADFKETERWVLNPGDMLYLPPQLAHYGISQGECMTYSIGFRAPSTAELLERTLDTILPTLTEDQRYADPNLTLQKNTGEIGDDAIQRLRSLLEASLNNDRLLADTLGQLLTESKYPDQAPEFSAEELTQNLTASLDEEAWQNFIEDLHDIPTLTRSEAARFAWHRSGSHLNFYAQGENVTLPATTERLVAMLGNQRHYEVCTILESAQDDASKTLLIALWQHQLIREGDEYGNPDN